MPGRTDRAEWRKGSCRWKSSGRIPGPGLRRFRKYQRGQATLEMLLVLIILIPLIFGSIELSRGIAVRAALDSGIGTAVRALAVDPSAWGWAAGNVVETVNQNVFGVAGLGTVNIIATEGSSPANLTPEEFAALTYGALFCLEGSVGYLPMIPLLYLGTDPITIKVKHCGVIERAG